MQRIQVPATNRNYPPNDFISPAYDRNCEDGLKSIYLILSTPRSGSTLLCDLIHNAGGPLGHEYFQHHGYIQCLASRWECLHDETSILPEKFIAMLIRNRCFNGSLCINLHGSHIKTFMQFAPFIPQCELKIIFLKRNRIIRQATSFAIASHTKAWSSAYKAAGGNLSPPSSEQIMEKIRIINDQNLLIESFLCKNNFKFLDVAYEDLMTKSLQEKVGAHLGLNLDISKATLKKQSNDLSLFISQDFANSFSSC